MAAKRQKAAPLTRAEAEAFTSKILSLDLAGWGGACGAAALLINDKVFGGKGKLVAGVNEYLLDQGHALGHVAVLFRGHYFDSDGEISEEDLLGWGMVDAEEQGFPEGTEELADEAILVQFRNEKELMKHFPWCEVIPSDTREASLRRRGR